MPTSCLNIFNPKASSGKKVQPSCSISEVLPVWAITCALRSSMQLVFTRTIGRVTLMRPPSNAGRTASNRSRSKPTNTEESPLTSPSQKQAKQGGSRGACGAMRCFAVKTGLASPAETWCFASGTQDDVWITARHASPNNETLHDQERRSPSLVGRTSLPLSRASRTCSNTAASSVFCSSDRRSTFFIAMAIR